MTSHNELFHKNCTDIYSYPTLHEVTQDLCGTYKFLWSKYIISVIQYPIFNQQPGHYSDL
jgi:hypothetical protein